ncbi:hypothetical protein PO124_24650 [Bacillus licheniformis]|nr:hypothetical protein [Bacillus licheniformis]
MAVMLSFFLFTPIAKAEETDKVDVKPNEYESRILNRDGLPSGRRGGIQRGNINSRRTEGILIYRFEKEDAIES